MIKEGNLIFSQKKHVFIDLDCLEGMKSEFISIFLFPQQAQRRSARPKGVSTWEWWTPIGCGAAWSAGRGWRSNCIHWRKTTPRNHGAAVRRHSTRIWVPCRNTFSNQQPSATNLRPPPLRSAPMTQSQGSWSAGALRCHDHQSSRLQDLYHSLIKQSSLASGNTINNIFSSIFFK